MPMSNYRNNRTPQTRRAATRPGATAATRRAATQRGASSRPRSGKTARKQQVRPSFARLPLVVAALAAIGIIAAVATTSLLNGPASDQTPATSASRAAYVSPYDFSGLSTQGDRMAYSEGGVQKSQVGVDVSEHQGPINWQAVKNDGIAFAFLRAGNRGTTEGGLFADSMFDENLTEAKDAGLAVGAYFYSQATSVEEAQEEADFVIGLLNGRSLDLPVVFDHEQDTTTNARGNSVDRSTLTAAANAFCERIESAGYRTMIYGNKVDIARLNLSDLGNRPVWFAEYNAAEPSGQFDFAIWQYTNTGDVAGISTPVDLNLRFTDAL